jgi:hypothetical protein
VPGCQRPGDSSGLLMLLGYIAESFPTVFSTEQQQQQQQQTDPIPLSLWTAMRLVAMLGDDTRPEFEGKIAEKLGELLAMMRFVFSSFLVLFRSFFV